MKEATKTSFVFHEDFLLDLPAEEKPNFAMYVYNYALYGESPSLDGFAETVWKKIARRIDAEREKYEQTKAKRAAAGRKHTGNQYARTEQTPQETNKTEQTESERNTVEQNGTEKTKAVRFVKPTADEIAAYCKEQGYSVNAEQFISYYESNGWRVGRNPMKSWKAAVTNWAKRQFDAPRNKHAGAMWGKENEIPDNYLDLV